MAVTSLDEARRNAGVGADDPWPPDDGASVAERADDEPEQEELFVLEQGRKVTLSNLIRRSTPVEYRASLRAKSVKGGGDMGLLSFSDPHITLVVPCRAGDVRLSPTYDDDGNVQKVVVYASFKPQTVYDAASPEGRAILGLE